MDTLFFLLFCLANGYVCVWVLINERRGNQNGEWGVIAMRVPDAEPGESPTQPNHTHGNPRGWKP